MAYLTLRDLRLADDCLPIRTLLLPRLVAIDIRGASGTSTSAPAGTAGAECRRRTLAALQPVSNEQRYFPDLNGLSCPLWGTLRQAAPGALAPQAAPQATVSADARYLRWELCKCPGGRSSSTAKPAPKMRSSCKI